MVLKTVIVGARGHGKVILDILKQKQDIIGFIDDDPTLHGSFVEGIPVIGSFSMLSEMLSEIDAGIVAIGDNRIRSSIFEKMRILDINMISALHPRSIIAGNVRIGRGTTIAAGAIVNPGSEIGADCIINTGATVDHDNLIGSHVHISPGVNLAGNVSIGEYSHIGIGAAVINGINIGKNVTIGAGAAVIRDIPDNTVAVGVPAKVIKYK